MERSNITKIFKALSNDQRLQLFVMIYNSFDGLKKRQGKRLPVGTITCCDGGVDKAFTAACQCMQISRSTISHHLKELKNAGLLICIKKGQSTVCKINKDAVKLVQNCLK